LNPADWGLAFRRAGPDDRSLALVLALGAAAGLLLVPFAPVLARLAPGCPFHALTGVPCPGCGTTRALVALAHGDFAGALAFNPLATAALLAGGAACLLAPVWILAGGTVPTLAPALPRRARLALVLAIAANWAWLIASKV
jgi:hypothetical protein